MNEVIKAIEERFSCRGYTGHKVDEDKLKIIAKSALHAPSAINQQPWRLLVINNKFIVEKLDHSALSYMKDMEDQSYHKRIVERGGKVFYDAPCLFLILRDKEQRWGEMDAGIMTQNIILVLQSYEKKFPT